MSDNNFMLPTDPNDLKRIKDAIIEISAQNQMIDDRKEQINDIKSDLKGRYNMTPALTNKLVKALDDMKYREMAEEHSMFEYVRESVLGEVSSEDDE